MPPIPLSHLRLLACLLPAMGIAGCEKPADAPTKVDAAARRVENSTRRPAASTLAIAPLNYNRDVRPILSDKCFQCHGPDDKKRDSGLRLDQPEAALAVLKKSGHVPIVAGKPEASEAWKRIESNDPDEHMPPARSMKTLSDAEKAVLKRWITEGAKYEKHWAFVAPARPALPEVKHKNCAKNPIDLFILAKLESEGFEPSPEADKETLLRRVSLDLTGLPPTPEETDAFLTDTSPDAYEKQVDRLLASPRFGERMASPWLDAARYADSHGFLQNYKNTMWPWRDWVIKSLNEDKPFDRFLTEQLAGDLLPGATEEQKLATGFNRTHPISFEGGSLAPEYENEYACDRVQTLGTAFLGLSLGCCRCHDHKFDPLPAEDFYALKAYFNSSSEKHLANGGAGIQALAPAITLASPLVPAGPKVKVMVMDELPAPKETFVLTRGQYDQPDKNRKVTRHPPHALNPQPAGSPANRLGLAQWLAANDNPLTARVAVNLRWAQLFGTGLVRTTDDFGLQGEYPSHPELLDWLACELRDGDGKSTPWSTKHLWRVIVTSATYRQASVAPKALAARDPANRWLGHFPRLRLPAETLRDQALHASGLLHEQLGGEPVFPPQPAGLWEDRANPDTAPYPGSTVHYPTSKGEGALRRSLYTFVNRTCAPPLINTFDGTDRTICITRRTCTNTPLQALAMLNEPQQLAAARALAERVLAEKPDTSGRLTRLLRRATGRKPTPATLAVLEKGLASLLARYRASPADAATLLNWPDAQPLPRDADLPELAAWTLVASSVLNLEQTMVRD